MHILVGIFIVYINKNFIFCIRAVLIAGLQSAIYCDDTEKSTETSIISANESTSSTSSTSTPPVQSQNRGIYIIFIG